MAQSLTPVQLLQATVFFVLTLTVTLRFLLPRSTIIHCLQLLLAAKLPSLLWDHRMLALSLSWCCFALLLAYFCNRPYAVLLLDYSGYKPDPDRRFSYEVGEYFALRSRRLSVISEEFIREIYRRSGIGDETYAPPYIFQADYEAKLASAVQESEEAMFGAVDSLFGKTTVDPSAIDVIVVACSMFTPSPSLTSMLVNRYGFKSSIKSFNFSGMGCSAGGAAIDAAAKILRRKPGYALIVTTESTSLNTYFGDDRSMLVTNCIFRVGAAAVLLTSDPAKRPAAKMELVRSLRTHHGADDASYGAAIQREDDDGIVGVALTKDLIRVAGAGLRTHIATLGPHVLPLSELVYYAYAVARSAVLGATRRPGGVGGGGGEEGKKPPTPAAQAHVPDFTKAFEHMCLHPGGKAVVNAVGRLMGLPEVVVEPARMALHRFGNTSCSSVFYELAYFEAKRRIKAGDRLWMLSFGTGFKACSLVWIALRDAGADPDNPWNDCIFRYPV